MIPSIIARCAVGAALLLTWLTWSSSPFAAAPLRAPGGGTVRALVIGIDRYPNLDQKAQLAGAVADARDISRVLTAAGARVQMLTDGDVIRSRVIAEMNRLVDESQSGDLAIISYSGHGMRVRVYPRWKGLDASPFHSQIALSRFSGGSVNNGHEIIVDYEMRAWYARLDAKGVDVLVVMDSCYGGHMRAVSEAEQIKVRSLSGDIDDAIHDSFVGIPMSQREARTNVKELTHVTFFAGATETSTVPEMTGIDSNDRKAVRGALSYFVARSIEGVAPGDGKVTRERLFKFLAPNVRQATEGRQFIDFEPRVESAEALQRSVFVVDKIMPAAPPTPGTEAHPAAESAESKDDPLRVAVANGASADFLTIQRARAPFVKAEPVDADLVWDVGQGKALSRGDLVMGQVDGTVLGNVIDRTWAVREIKKLSASRIIDVKMGEEGRSYTLGDHPQLVVSDIRDSYLTVVNIAADGTIQLLFPFYADHDPHITTDRWSYMPAVSAPFGTDYTVAIATAGPATNLLAWLRSHTDRHDAFELPAIIARTLAADAKARVGTAGLYTTP
jgi:Caspase domain/Domain of unknown function (DUF4384)